MVLVLWEKFPALFVGLALLCGCALALDFQLPFLIPLLSLMLFRKGWIVGIVFSVALLGFGMTKLRYAPPTEGKMWEGKGHFVVSGFRKSSSPFHETWRYDGKFKWFEGEEIAKNLSCSIYLPLSTSAPEPDRDYLLEGTLKRRGKHFFVFKPKKKEAWKEIPGSFHLAKWRYQAKDKLRSYLKRKLPHVESFNFLSALATGEIGDREMSFTFGRIGLQHILAISGFHFGFIVLLLTLFLQIFLTPRLTAVILLHLITVYFFFIGGSPSCQRAWIAITFFLVGRLFNLRTSGLNILGLASIIALLIDPLILLRLGFQLTFLMTLAILLFYPIFEALLSHLLPPRPLPTLLSMNRLNQHGYIFSSLLRKTLSLNGAVHLFAIPTLLFLFHKFPLLSLLYNLFFPFCVGFSLMMLVLGLLLPPLLYLNSIYTSFLVKLTSYPPLFFHFFFRVKEVPLWGLMLFLTLCFWGGLISHKLTESPF